MAYAHEHKDGDPGSLPARGRRQAAAAVPPAVAGRFLHVGDKYFFPDRSLAFVDRGDKLSARTHNAEVVRSLVAIAEVRGWVAIRVRGSEAFRREVWRAAARRGIDVRGYEPDDVERVALQRQFEREAGSGADRDRSRSQPQGFRPPAPAQTPGDPVSTPPGRTEAPAAGARGARGLASRPSPAPSRRQGRLVEHGAAPYRFDPRAGLSYFVRLATDDGEHVLWGVDLERAIVESRSRVRVGDVVAVESRRSRRVQVRVTQPARAGEQAGEQGGKRPAQPAREKTIEAQRNEWTVEAPAWFAERDAQLAALRSARVPVAELARRHPDLASAAVGLWLGERFAERLVERPEDRERIVAGVRERLAQRVEQGERIPLPAAVRDKVVDRRDEHTQRSPLRAVRRGGRPAQERARPEPPQARA